MSPVARFDWLRGINDDGLGMGHVALASGVLAWPISRSNCFTWLHIARPVSQSGRSRSGTLLAFRRVIMLSSRCEAALCRAGWCASLPPDGPLHSAGSRKQVRQSETRAGRVSAPGRQGETGFTRLDARDAVSTIGRPVDRARIVCREVEWNLHDALSHRFHHASGAGPDRLCQSPTDTLR